MTNPLAPIMGWYRISLDCMNVTIRVINQRIPKAIIRKHVFHNEPESSCLESIEKARNELEDLVVLSLVATFERTLREFVMERPRGILGGGPIDDAIHSEIMKDIEYWNLPERLIGVFQEHIESTHRGLVKQIIGYRNWVAHGKKTEIPPSGSISPEKAFKHLSDFLVKAKLIDVN
jgi:hypothetical protein